jgi:hypothetical protein
MKIFIYAIQIVLREGKFIPVFNEVPCHEDTCGVKA